MLVLAAREKNCGQESSVRLEFSVEKPRALENPYFSNFFSGLRTHTPARLGLTMDPKLPSGSMMMAPPADGSLGTRHFPSSRDPERREIERRLPPVDQHIVTPETTRDQVIRGRHVIAMPSLPEHGDPHFSLDYLLGAHVKEGYVGSTDLLTRVAERSNFASDTCVRKKGVDPKTGERYLEELAFEVVNEQSNRDINEQAEDMTARGVRRVVAVFVKKRKVCEWSTATSSWQELDLDGTFTDPTLARPIRVRDFLYSDETDNAVVHALVDKGNRVFITMVETERNDVRMKERRQAVRDLCEVLGMNVTPQQDASLDAMPLDGLDELRSRIKRNRTWD